jgi:hypothetical protein
MISLILYLSSLGAITWFGLKAFDWALGEYGRSKVQAYKVITPDRPSDPYMEQVRQRIDALTGPGEALKYPAGS